MVNKIVAIIPARGGSKRIHNKNLYPIFDKPLIQYTIEAARNIFDDKEIVISTDSEEIIDLAKSLGIKIPFIRPKDLCGDEVGMHEVVLHALTYFENKYSKPDKIILLQPTSPFRTKNHINEAINEYSPLIDMVVSVKETSANPYFVLREESDQGFLEPSKSANFIRRQDCPIVYELNGAIYIINPDSIKLTPMHEFKKVKKFVMDEVSSIDIDNHIDWRIAEMFIKKSNVTPDI